MRVMVTGASGFLGANLCRALEAIGIEPVAAIRNSSDLWRLKALTKSVETFEFDIINVDEYYEKLSELSLDAIVNCAGYGVNYNEQDSILAFEINVKGAYNLAQYANSNSIRFIQIGTSYEYGEWESAIDEDCPLKPNNLYGKTKAAASISISTLCESTNADIVILRLFSMYGPLEGQHKVVPAVMNAHKTGKVFELTEGNQLRDYTYVGDVVEAIIKAIKFQNKWQSNVLNICSGHEYSLREFLEAAAPNDLTALKWGAKPYRVDEMMRVVGSPILAKETLDWSAKTDLIEGMAKIASFEIYRPQGK